MFVAWCRGPSVFLPLALWETGRPHNGGGFTKWWFLLQTIPKMSNSPPPVPFIKRFKTPIYKGDVPSKPDIASSDTKFFLCPKYHFHASTPVFFLVGIYILFTLCHEYSFRSLSPILCALVSPAVSAVRP